MDAILDGLRWLTTWSNWGPGGDDISRRVIQHLWYSLVATTAAVAIGLPIGLAIGHTGKGKFLAANVAGLWRAIPTIGVVMLVFRWRPLSVWPVIASLVILAIPPIVLNTVAGIESVPADVRDAASGMGLTRWQRLWQVEVPNALPLILAGIRSAANQVIATATVAGLVGLGTLGYFVVLGARTQDYEMMAGASIAIIVLVLVVEGVFALAQRVLVSPGVRARATRRRRWRTPVPTAAVPVSLDA
ncbi:MAG: ABC transporter permease [Desertimonas sp.]